MQILWNYGLTSEEYVKAKAWQKSSLRQCPICGAKKGEGWSGHGNYQRKSPTDAKVPRYYCRKCKKTFSLLADCLAAGYSSSLAEVETAFKTLNNKHIFDHSAEQLRPEIEIQGARRWLRRRQRRVKLAILITATILAVGTNEIEIVEIRQSITNHLQNIPTPIGFCHRPLSYWNSRNHLQHTMGPDPPK